MYKNEQCLVKQRRSNIELFRIITMLIISINLQSCG